MKKTLFILSIITLFISCQEVKIVDNNNQFKKGVFEIPAGDGYGKTTITRIDSLQIEEYTKIVSISTDSIVKDRIYKHIDTLYIEWKNNFSYILRMKSPKTSLDKDQIFVKINKVTDSSYSFIARIGYSKFKQTGTVYKAKK
jgi:hypothetical protein